MKRIPERKHKAGSHHLFLTMIAGATATLPVVAAPLQFMPQVAVSGIYTDNIELQPPGLAADELVLEVRPSFELTSSTDRFDGELEYQLQHFKFREDSNRDQTYHNAGLRTTTEVVGERLMLDVTGGYGQVLVDPRAPIPGSNVIESENLTNYAALDARPYLIQPLGGRAQLRAAYDYGIVRYPDFDFSTGNNIDSFDRSQVALSVGADPSEPGLLWLVEGRKQTAKYEDFGKFRTDFAVAELAVPVGRQFYLLGRGGSESDVEQDSRAGGLNEPFWEAGVRWSVNQRQEMEVRVGERFFGDTYFFNLNVQRTRVNASINYQEAPTTASLEQLNPRRTLIRSGDVPQYDVVELTSDVYINKELLADVSYGMARSELLFQVRDARREYVTTLDSDRETGGSVGVFWRLGPRTELGVNAYHARIRFRGTTVEDQLTQYSLGVSRQLGRRTILALQLRASERDSDAQQQSTLYDENAATLTWTMGFGRTELNIGGRSSLPTLRR